MQNIKEGIEGKAVSWYHDVFSSVFPNIDKKKANNVWKSQIKKSRSKERREAKEAKHDREKDEDEDEDDDD